MALRRRADRERSVHNGAGAMPTPTPIAAGHPGPAYRLGSSPQPFRDRPRAFGACPRRSARWPAPPRCNVARPIAGPASRAIGMAGAGDPPRLAAGKR